MNKDIEKRAARQALIRAALDIGTVAGGGLFIWGLYLVYHPLAQLAGGLFLAAGCIFAAYDLARKARSPR